MKHYIRVYVMLLKMNMSKLLMYRANFVNSLISSLVWCVFSFVFIILLTSKTTVIHGWTRGELILLMALYNIIIGGIFHTLFSSNFHRFSNIIHFGQLDSFLLKPLDSQFLLSSQSINYTSLARIIIGIIVSIYISAQINLHVNIVNILMFIFLSIAGLILLYSIWFVVLTTTIWFTRLSNLLGLLYSLNDLTRLPPQMYKPLRSYALFILPYTLILITPAKAVLNKLTVGDAIGLVFFAAIFFLLSRKFWKFALKYYTSASS